MARAPRKTEETESSLRRVFNVKTSDAQVLREMMTQILRNQRTAFHQISRTCGNNQEMHDAYVERVAETDKLLKKMGD